MKSSTLILAAAALIALSACGGGTAPAVPPVVAPVDPVPPVVTPPVVTPPTDPVPPVVTPSDPPPLDPNAPPEWFTLLGHCEKPRQGLSPTGFPYNDVQGTLTDELKWLRSFVDATYLWYKEVPANLKLEDYHNTLDWFAVLKTNATTASGRAKDRFHFTYPTEQWDAMTTAGVQLGYGLTWVRNADPAAPRVWILTMVEPGSQAEQAGLRRGDQLVSVDDVAIGDNSAAGVAKLNAGLTPVTAGEVHRFVLSRGGMSLAASLTSLRLAVAPVLAGKVLDTPTGKVGYLQFNEHNAVSEGLLVKNIADFKTAGITDLVLDMRYNGGGLLSIASELAYMIAGPVPTAGKTFERSQYNDKTKPQAPQPFATVAAGYQSTQPVKAGSALPYLGLKRVTVLTTPGTCSASESVINSLRGVDIEVNLIGGETCGKPYAFVPAANCGTTYFTIQFQGVNDKGYGDYADGFAPTCSVSDDLTHALGDPAEGLLATALKYRTTGVCPAQPLRSRAVQGAMQLVRPPVKEISIYDRR